MRKWVGMLLVFVLLFGISMPAVGAEEAQEESGFVLEQEPNDAVETANAILVEDWVDGSISPEDVDFYKFNVSKKGIFYTAGTNYYYEEGVKVTLYDKQGIPYQTACEGFSCQQTLEPGTYYLKLEAINQFDGDYSFFSYMVEPGVHRISGKNRYETAVSVANEGWSEGAGEIILATGEDFPDALAAGPLAYYLFAPILLTTKDTLPESVKTFIKDKGVEKVTIIGGTGVVSSGVEGYLRKTLGLTVERISGKDRFETAVKIANELPESPEAIVVNGRNYPDALSASSYAAQFGIPILLTETNALPTVTTNKLAGFETTTVVGGTGVVSTTVFNKLPDPQRISGKNRYETSVKMAEYMAEFYPSVSSYVATGENFADALSGSVMAAFSGAPIILTLPTTLLEQTKAYFNDYNVIDYTILGGTGAVSSQIEQKLLSIANSQL